MAWNISKSRKPYRRPDCRRRYRPQLDVLEDRVVPSLTATTFGGNAQHTSIYDTPAQDLNAIQWQHTIDDNAGAFAHYGAPLISAANTVFAPVKTASNHFRIDALNAADGATKFSLYNVIAAGDNHIDYVLPSYGWIPVYQPVLATGSFAGGVTTRLYYAGIGGTIYYVDNPDSVSHGAPVQVAFYGTHTSAYDTTVFINTPLTADASGNVFFGFRTQGTAPGAIGTQSGFARIPADGSTPAYVLAANAAVLAGSSNPYGSIQYDSHNSAPALSNDGSILYVVVKNGSEQGYLLGLTSSNLTTVYKTAVNQVSDYSTASPTVGPDGDVYFGILGTGSRGHLLHFSGTLDPTGKAIGAFGWDYTAAIVPASMVPSYQGTSTYLIFAKYNHYTFGADGINKVALLDPNATEPDPSGASDGYPTVMREVFTIIGPTPDSDQNPATYPNAVREWCINTSAVNPATNSIFFDSEDGRVYRWNLATNQLSQQKALTPGIGEPYVPTVIGPDGVVYSINGNHLFALGTRLTSGGVISNVDATLVSSVPDLRSVVSGQSLTFTATVTGTNGTGTPSGTVTFQDETHYLSSGMHTVVTQLTVVALDGAGHASLTMPISNSVVDPNNGNQTFAVNQHFISAVYSGDSTHSAATASLVQKVHDSATTTTLTPSANPSSPGQAVTFTATVTGTGGTPTGMVTFMEGTTVLAQSALSGGSTSFTTSSLGIGSHTISAVYYSDIKFATSTGSASAVVQVTTSTSAASSPNPATFGNSVTFTAAVASTGGVPSGSVTFTEGANVLASEVPVDGTGHASFSSTTLAVGSHTITASFIGNPGWLNSSGNAPPQTVQDNTSTTVASSLNPSHFGDTVTFTATVTAAHPAAGVPNGTVTFTEGATTWASNVSVDGIGHASFATSALSFGNHVITASFTGTTGWLTSSGNSLTQIVQDGTSTSVASSANPSNFGTSVTFTATVTGANGGTPTGTVTFTEGPTVLASSVPLDGSGQAAFSTAGLGVGSHLIHAAFTGTGGWLNSSGDAAAQIVQDGTSTTVSSSLNPSTFGQSISFTATVAAADASAGTPPGTVTFTEGVTVLASNVAVDGAGHASFSTTSLGVGPHTIAATFTGATGWLGSNGDSAAQQVTDGTGTAVSSSPNPSAFGGSVTFTATVIAADAGAGIPTGAVTFTEGASVLASNVAVNGSGQASFSTTGLSVGSHTITATFTGTGGWQNSAGNDSSVPQVVNNGTTTSALSAPNPSTFGDSVTFTATVTDGGAGAGVPTGTVTFTEGVTVLASGVAVDGAGHASFSTATLGVGSHTITASFTGTGGWQNSSDNTAAQLVQDTTTTTLVSSGSPVDFRQNVIFTATVTADHSGIGAGVPVGTVSFTEGATVLAANVPVDGSGHASFSDDTLSMGDHTITATFTGAVGWGGSSGSTDQEIQEGTSVALSTNPTVANFGQQITFGATISVENPAAPIPTGSVTFSEGATILAADVALDAAGHAEFSSSSLSVGTHNITADFTGTNGFEDSSGVSGPIQVQDGTSTSVTSSPNPSTFGQAVTFTAAISAADAGAGVSTGTVTFTEGATTLASNVAVDGSGQATFSTSGLGVGSHTITATFTGTNGWLGSNGASAPQAVQDGTNTSVSSSSNPSSFGQSVTFTATITAADSGAGTPTGTVTFTEGATTLASGVTVDGSGHASFSNSGFGVGSHTITASFTGTNGWLGSNGNSASQLVQDGSSTTVISSPNPSNFGQSVTFTATITAVDSGAGTPTGTVTFTEGANTLASGVAVDGSGHASFSTSGLGVGSHTITATFTGTNGWQDSSGNTAPQVVNAVPSLSINDVSVTEGNSGTKTVTFTVTLSPSSANTVTVNYATADGTATAGSDYVAKSGTLSFSPGITSQTFTVTINGDTLDELDETFFVNLSGATGGAAIADAQGQGTIIDNDSAGISINNISVNEGDSGTVAAVFTLSLNKSADHSINVNFATGTTGTASSGVDYQATSGTATFAPFATATTVTVLVNGDLIDEANETFFVNLTNPTPGATISDSQGRATIVDDDTSAISISDYSHAEGNSGTTTFTFTVTLSTPNSRTVSVHYATANGSAISGSDYTSKSGTLSIAAGQMSQIITVNVTGDTTIEPNETFFVNLTSPSNAVIADTQGVGTILNDDGASARRFANLLFDASHTGAGTGSVPQNSGVGLVTTNRGSATSSSACAATLDALFSSPSARELGSPVARGLDHAAGSMWTLADALLAWEEEVLGRHA
ncbi:MAG: Ig-like domain repeat protein [Planctomycetes bacterium]|nr:Ig-like domain repeat protein [Planctomycetota bacterium]